MPGWRDCGDCGDSALNSSSASAFGFDEGAAALRGANNFTFDDSCKNDQANRWPRKAQVLVGTNRILALPTVYLSEIKHAHIHMMESAKKWRRHGH